MNAQDVPDSNPQQQPTTASQILDRDTYDGHTPLESYPTSDPDMDSQSDSEVLNDDSNTSRPSRHVDDDIQKLAESMTLRELAGQMTQIQIGMLLDSEGELDLAKVEYWVREWGVGSFLDTPTKLDSVHGANYVDGAIMFPQQIGLAATFNATHAYEAGRITAKDTRAAGIPWVFAPILDVAVHKLWPRVYESFGEDPHVVSVMGSAVIKGLQGNYKKDRTRVAACMKHFIGYSASRNGQDKSSAWIPDNYLMDYFVPSFQAAIDSGVATAMETYIDVNGQPVVGSHFYLTELLRHRMGFNGMLVTDWQELDRLFTEHRTVPILKDATLQCLKQTSVDMVMVPESESFSKDAVNLVQEGKLDKVRLVEGAARVLQLKKDLGLFDEPLSNPELLPLVGSGQDIEAARNAVRESITLLKNQDNVLPLSRNKSSNKKIFVTGPAADSIRALSGGWSIKWQGAESDEWYQDRGESILNGLRQEFGENTVTYMPSVDFDGNLVEEEDQDAYVDKAAEADTIIVCLGEKPYAEIVGNIDNLDMPWGQLEVILKLSERIIGTDTKLILVLVEGRPRTLGWLVDRVDAIVMAYLPGPWGGLPIAEVISGTVNPSGRLPITYPRGPSDMGSNYYRSGIDPYNPLFPFGAGLSYSVVEYSGLTLDSTKLYVKNVDKHNVRIDNNTEEENEKVNDNEQNVSESESNKKVETADTFDVQAKANDPDSNDDDNDNDGYDSNSQTRHYRHHHHVSKRSVSSSLIASSQNRRLDKQFFSLLATVTLRNAGDRPVKETVFWYITQDYRSEVMPEAFMLRGFEKVTLDAGEVKTVNFRILQNALTYHDRYLRKRVDTGGFTLTVNAMRPEAKSIKFNVIRLFFYDPP
ncbi:hypothetical protein FBU30_009407 [Linnemannia zychae]|nr:hypothetical protein FBU30_009407 [Linnemannia zychae]